MGWKLPPWMWWTSSCSHCRQNYNLQTKTLPLPFEQMYHYWSVFIVKPAKLKGNQTRHKLPDIFFLSACYYKTSTFLFWTLAHKDTTTLVRSLLTKRRKKVGIWQTYFMYDNFTPHFGLNDYVIYVNLNRLMGPKWHWGSRFPNC